MKNIIKYFENQTYTDFEVIFIVDKILKKWDDTYKNHGKIRFITNLNSTFIPHYGWFINASYNRNFWIDIAEWDYIQLMDDDEQFPEDYLERSMNLRFKYRKEIGRDIVLTPTLMYRKTGEIQNQGFSYFSYRLSRPILQKLWEKKRDYIQMYSGNSLLALAETFKENPFDENIDFVYEDLDFTYNIHRAGIPIIVLKDLEIYHMEREKTLLEQARVGHELQAYKKSKHRIVFVRKYWNRTQRMQFYLLGLRAQPLRLLGKVLRYGKGKDKWKIIRGMRQWFWDGWKKI